MILLSKVAEGKKMKRKFLFLIGTSSVEGRAQGCQKFVENGIDNQSPEMCSLSSILACGGSRG